MLATKAEIIAAGRALSEEERLEVIAELEATLLPEPPYGLTAQQWSAELDRRWQEAETHPEQVVTWEQLRAEIRSRNQGHG